MDFLVSGSHGAVPFSLAPSFLLYQMVGLSPEMRTRKVTRKKKKNVDERGDEQDCFERTRPSLSWDLIVRFIISISVLGRDLLTALCQIRSLNVITIFPALSKILLLVFMNCNESFMNIKPWIFHERLEIFGSKYMLLNIANCKLSVPLSGTVWTPNSS